MKNSIDYSIDLISIDLRSNIMSNCQGIFIFTMFFSNAGKTGNVPEFKFDIF